MNTAAGGVFALRKWIGFERSEMRILRNKIPPAGEYILRPALNETLPVEGWMVYNLYP